ncbi:hypothetical protein ILYODFUR_003551 [Ilyodon furcidens]|uniref:Uncharacterized protein n=1 Tax=Ilyodon furcidens TaxID=33524 RepID=A0ABV0VD85_9TELE
MLVCPLRLKLNNTQLLCSAYFCRFLRRNIVRAKSSSFYTDFAAFYLTFWNGVDECVLRAGDGVLSHNVLLSNAPLNRITQAEADCKGGFFKHSLATDSKFDLD